MYGYDVVAVEVDSRGNCKPCYTDDYSLFAAERITDYIEIPCGHCIGCRLAYSRQWADRCMLELMDHQHAWFLTLTYDDVHLPINHWVDYETGEFGVMATLVKRDFQLFMKRLRKAYCTKNGITASNIRFFAAGEYGSQTLRPHYHAIIYGLELDDLKVYKQNRDLHYTLYNSEWLSSIWQKGHVVIGQVTWDTCAYTARYIMKKMYGNDKEIYEKYNYAPEFTLMSRRPGIGRNYYEKHKEDIKDHINRNDTIPISDCGTVRQIKPARYFERLLELDEPEFIEDIKKTRSLIMADLKEIKLEQTDLDYLSMLQVQENSKTNSIKRLKRKEI